MQLDPAAEKEFEVPAFIRVADTHNLGNSADQKSEFSPFGIFEGVANFFSKGVPLAVGAGATELANAVPSLGNWLGGNFELIDYKAAISNLDTDYGEYYTAHKQGIDAAGFIASSLVPGMAGVKGLRWGQGIVARAVESGTLGEGTALALGLKVTNREKYLSQAIREIGPSGNTFSFLEANTLKAIGAGFAQQALEAAAFETAVAATLHNSPFFDQMSTSDMIWNGLIGIGLGGAVGGALEAAFARSAIKAGATAAEKELAPWAWKEDYTGVGLSPMDRAINLARVRDSLPPALGEGPLAARSASLRETTLSKLDLEARKAFGELSAQDQGIAQALHDTWKLRSLDENAQAFLDVEHASRIGQRSQQEIAMDAIGKKVKKGVPVTDEEFQQWAESNVTFVGVRGEHIGKRFEDKPELPSVFDVLRVKSSDDIVLNDRGVMIAGKQFVHENNPQRPFNIFGVDHYVTETRRVWAARLPAFEDGVEINQYDVPLLEKAVKDGLSEIRVVPREGGISAARTISGKELIRDYVIKEKQEVIDMLIKGDTAVYTLDTIVDKLLTAFGIKFNTVSDQGTNGFWTRLKGMLPETDKVLFGEVINMSPDALVKSGKLARPLQQIVRTLKHEEGHSIFQALLDARGVGRSNLDFATALPELKDELTRLSKRARPELWKSKDPSLIEYRKGLHELFADASSYLAINPDKLKQFPAFNKYFGHTVREVPEAVMQQFVQRIKTPSLDEIADIANVRRHILDQQVITEPGNPRYISQWFARDEYAQEYRELMGRAGTRDTEQLADPLTLPKYIKLFSVKKRTKGIDGVEMEGLAGLMQRVKVYEESAKRIAAQNLGEAGTTLPEISNLEVSAHRDGSSGFFSSADAPYGSWMSAFQRVGSITHSLIRDAKQGVSDKLHPLLTRLSTDTDALLEWSMLQEKMRFLPQKYVLDSETGNLVLKPGLDVDEAVKLAQQGVPQSIEIKSPLVRDLVKAHVELNGNNLQKLGRVRRNEGKMDFRDPETFYPIPRDPKDTPFFAFVIDDSMNSTGHHSMIYAASEQKLEEMIRSIKQDMPESFRVLSKKDTEEYFKAHGQYEFERSVNDNYINEFLRRKGTSTSLLPLSDPKRVVEQVLDWHLGKAANVIRETVAHRYSRQFGYLQDVAAETANLSSSRFKYVSIMEAAENRTNNPALNAIKTALDIQKSTEYPFWTSFNKMVDGAASRVWQKVDELQGALKSDEDYAKIDATLRAHGYVGPLVDDVLYRAVNSSVPRGLFTSFVNKANGVLATLTLRMDLFNALNNALGHSVPYGTEVKSVLKAIRDGNGEIAGDLLSVKIPGMEDSIPTHGKLFKQAIENFFRRDSELTFGGETLAAYYKKHGFITSISEQYDQVLDQLSMSLAGKESVANAFAKIRKIGDVGEKITGNRIAEEFNRFIAADTMRQLTDIAIKQGVMDEATALTYINTFINRTQGNYLASQRPLLFQGPVGQALGLFQTYQFNLLQQLFRHIESREGRVVATMAGLQTGMYGMNGMPFFNALNTHIIGSASGNTNHTDFYNVVYSAAGKEAGDWLMYGFASNAMGLLHPDLKNNIYVRGDINPRQLTIVPVNPADIPFVSASTKLLSNVKESFKKIGAGGDLWGTFLNALEHNGVSRPLTGIAQALGGLTSSDGKVVSTSTQGNVNMLHDFASLTTMMRIAGAKPLDEAIISDARSRFTAYDARDAARRSVLGETIKNSLIYGEKPDADQISEFASQYVKAGGKQDRFNQFMATMYKNASVSQANQLRQTLSSYKNQQLQTLLGGQD